MSRGYAFRASISAQSGLNMKLMENRIPFCIQIPWELLLEYLRSVCLMSCSEIKATVWVSLKWKNLESSGCSLSGSGVSEGLLGSLPE